MEFYLIKRLPLQPFHNENWCDTFVGTTEKNAKTDAVNSVMIEWFDERVESGDEVETEDVKVIYDKYISFWDEEELWSIEKCVI